MAAIHHHARRLYVGTTAERAAVVPGPDGIDSKYWDTTVGVLYRWNGLAWYVVDLNGVADALVLDADGDTTLSAPTDDEIDIEVGGVDVAEWRTGGLYEAAGRDVYPEGDGGGLFQRNVNHWRTPDDHFNAFAGWLWDAVIFNGAPSTVDVATYPSLLRLMNDNIAEDHFGYQVVATGSTRVINARLYVGVNSYIGIRLDDGTNDNFLEVRLTSSAVPGFLKLQHRHRVGGGAINSGDMVDELQAQFYDVRILRTAAVSLIYYVVDTPIAFNIGGWVEGAWTATRWGLIFGQRGVAGSGDRAGLMDWIELS